MEGSKLEKGAATPCENGWSKSQEWEGICGIARGRDAVFRKEQ